jgi:hypothetical protein
MSQNKNKKNKEPVLLDRHRKPPSLRLPAGVRRHFTRRRVKWLTIVLMVLAIFNWDHLIPDPKPLNERQATTRAELHARQDQLGRFPTAFIAHAEEKDGKWYIWLESVDPKTNSGYDGFYRVLIMEAMSGKITIVDEGSGPLPRAGLPP